MNQTLGFILIVLLVVDLLVVALRSSLANLRMPHLVTSREQHPESVERTIELMENPRLRPMLRLLVVLLHILLAGVFTLLWISQPPNLTTLPLTLLALFVAGVLVLAVEFFLEGILARNAEEWAIFFTPLGRFLNLIFTPLSVLMMALMGTAPAAPVSIPVTDDELRTWVKEDQPESTLEKGERRMIYSIFQFGDTLCREIMVPRIDVLALDINTPVDEAIQAVTASGHSRLPVYEDTIDNVIGVLYAKDLLRARLDDNPAQMRALLRPAFFVPEAKKVEELLREMQARGVHISIVVDEYGGMAGLVTLEDIVEEIVGEIRDEYDQSEELPYQEISPDEYVFQGRIDLEDFNEILDTHLVKDAADTLGGYINAQIGHIPTGGETLSVGDWLLTVQQVSGRRIRKVHARREPAATEMEEHDNNAER